MAKKSIKQAAAEGTSIFDQIASGNTQDVEYTTYVQNIQNAQNAPSAQLISKTGVELARLNLKIPAEIKEYLTVAAAKASIEQKRNISLTEYLCGLVRADMEQHKDE